ncbi:MAG: hypothetical protein R2751_16795 [Bacteroidales bacterium]
MKHGILLFSVVLLALCASPEPPKEKKREERKVKMPLILESELNDVVKAGA